MSIRSGFTVFTTPPRKTHDFNANLAANCFPSLAVEKRWTRSWIGYLFEKGHSPHREPRRPGIYSSHRQALQSRTA